MTHIGDELERIWDHAEHSIASIIHHSGYHAPSSSAPEGTIMSLATFEATIKDDLATGLAKAEELASHLKTVAEEHLPQLAAIQASPITQALEGFVLPPEAEAFIAKAVSFLVTQYGQPAGATTASPAAPAEPEPAPVAS